MPLQPADQRPLDQQRLQQQLGRLGGSGWRLRDLTVELEGDLFLPVAELNRMRRALLEALGPPVAPQQVTSVSSDPASALSALAPVAADAPRDEPMGLVVLVRSLTQLRALMELPDGAAPIRSVVADLEQPRQLREAVAMARGIWSEGIWLAGSRITRPDERWTLEPLIRARPDGYLVRNADQLEILAPGALHR